LKMDFVHFNQQVRISTSRFSFQLPKVKRFLFNILELLDSLTFEEFIQLEKIQLRSYFVRKKAISISQSENLKKVPFSLKFVARNST